MYDVVVIGCGPAGLMAGRELKKENINFLCIDTRKKIGEPLRCGEGIRKKDFAGIFGNTNYKFILNEVGEHKLIYGKEKTIKEPYLELDKTEFEKWLAKPIQKNIQSRVICKNVRITKDFVEIETKKRNLKTKLVIIATGPNYNIQEKLGMLKNKPPITCCYGGVYSNFKLNEKCFYFFYEKEKNGYFWAFPKGKGKVNVGYGGWAGNTKRAFKELLKKHKFENLKFERELGGIFPSSGPIKKLMITGYLLLEQQQG